MADLLGEQHETSSKGLVRRPGPASSPGPDLDRCHHRRRLKHYLSHPLRDPVRRRTYGEDAAHPTHQLEVMAGLDVFTPKLSGRRRSIDAMAASVLEPLLVVVGDQIRSSPSHMPRRSPTRPRGRDEVVPRADHLHGYLIVRDDDRRPVDERRAPVALPPVPQPDQVMRRDEVRRPNRGPRGPFISLGLTAGVSSYAGGSRSLAGGIVGSFWAPIRRALSVFPPLAWQPAGRRGKSRDGRDAGAHPDGR
jgi:hypothetical protein